MPDESLSETKFRAFINAFKPSGSISKRAALNAFISSFRKTWGSIFLTTEFGYIAPMMISRNQGLYFARTKVLFGNVTTYQEVMDL